VGPELALGPRLVALPAYRRRHVEHDGNSQTVMLLRERDECATRLGLDVGGIDHREAPCLKALAGDEVEDLEGRLGRRLVVLVIGHEATAEVR
jgi:hypothetical protein